MYKYFKKHVSRYAEEVAEVLAPTYRTPQEEFKHYWATVSDLLTNKATGVADADADRDAADEADEADKIFQLLDKMLDMILSEESEHDGMGPCMEFMLQGGGKEGVLKQLVNCGQLKWPVGIMGRVLHFFAKLLSELKQPMLPDKHWHGPIKELLRVHVSTDGLVAQNEGSAIDFLEALCDKLGQFPGCADFFIQSVEGERSAFLPSQMLQPLLVSAVDEVSQMARNCLRIILQMQSPTVDAIVVEAGMESAFIVQHFVRLYAALAPHFDAEEVQTNVVEWCETRFDGWKRFRAAKHAGIDEDTRAFFAFMDWIHFCDDVLEACSEVLADHLINNIIASFFVAQLVPMLTQQSEEVAYATTYYLTACITQISSRAFLRGVTSFLLGPTVTPAAGAPVPPAAEASERVCALLVQRCDDISDELSEATLHLFHRTLQKRDPATIGALVLRHAAPHVLPPLPVLRKAMHAMADQFTAEMPEGLRTAEDTASYKEHFIDAQRAVLESRRVGALFTVGAAAAGGLDDAAAEDAGPDFDADDDADDAAAVEGGGAGAGPEGDDAAEGDVAIACTSPFLKVLARKLRQLPNQPHRLNLLVTANYAALLEYASPVLHAVMLTPSEHSLYTALTAVCSELKSKSVRIDNVEARLQEEREKLETMLQAETLHQMSQSLQAMIVIEEFSKEIAARLLVQCNEMLLDT